MWVGMLLWTFTPTQSPIPDPQPCLKGREKKKKDWGLKLEAGQPCSRCAPLTSLASPSSHLQPPIYSQTCLEHLIRPYSKHKSMSQLLSVCLRRLLNAISSWLHAVTCSYGSRSNIAIACVMISGRGGRGLIPWHVGEGPLCGWLNASTDSLPIYCILQTKTSNRDPWFGGGESMFHCEFVAFNWCSYPQWLLGLVQGHFSGTEMCFVSTFWGFYYWPFWL